MPRARARLISARMVRALAPYLEKRGIRLIDIAQRAGVLNFNLQDPDHELPFDQVVLLLEIAARELDDEFLGLHFGSASSAYPLGLFHYLVMNSPTVGEALKARAHYLPLFGNSYRSSVTKTAGGFRYTWEFSAACPPHQQYSQFMAAVFIGQMRLMIENDEWTPAFVDFDFAKPAKSSRLWDFFGRKVFFNRPSLAVGIDGRTMKLPVASADEWLLGELETIAKKLLASDPACSTLIERASQEIAVLLPSGRATAPAVASNLGMSVRTLQGKLAGENTSFRQLVEETRVRLAKQLLLHSRRPLSEIAYLLGFSELSAFSRAAKAWFGETPSAIRRNSGLLSQQDA